MKKISVPRPQSDSLPAQLLSLYKTFKNTLPSESLEFELSSLDWICPFLILPISVYISDTKSKFAVNDFSTIKPYLEVIRFPKGVDSISSFEQQIQRHKNYIPISVLRKDAGIARGRLESLFQALVYKNFGSISGAQNAVYYPISELVTNIFEHSKCNEGFVFGQFYPTKRYLDICIVDRGRGLRKAYQQEKGLQLSDEDAITEVMKGTSIKPDMERGYGVWTSKRIVCEGLGGEFILMSGSAALISMGKKGKLVSLPNFKWQGVIVAYRMPTPEGPVDISLYVE